MRRVYKIVVWRDGGWWSLNRAIFPKTKFQVPYPVGRSAHPLPGSVGLLAFGRVDIATDLFNAYCREMGRQMGQIALWEAIAPTAEPPSAEPSPLGNWPPVSGWFTGTLTCPSLILLRPLAVYSPETGKVWRAEE